MLGKWLLVFWHIGSAQTPWPEVRIFDTQHDCHEAGLVAMVGGPGTRAVCAEVQSMAEIGR